MILKLAVISIESFITGIKYNVVGWCANVKKHEGPFAEPFVKFEANKSSNIPLCW